MPNATLRADAQAMTMNRRAALGVLAASALLASSRFVGAASASVPTAALKPFTASEWVATMRDLGNEVGLTPCGAVFVRNMGGVKTPEWGGEFGRRLGLWADECRARGGKYIDEVADYLEAETA